MNYTKPEVAVLGDASEVIQGGKISPTHLDGPSKLPNLVPAYDLDE